MNGTYQSRTNFDKIFWDDKDQRTGFSGNGDGQFIYKQVDQVQSLEM